MGYDENFYIQYKAYLDEPTVRQAHDWVFSVLCGDNFNRVVDFGCGKAMEFLVHYSPKFYLGIDNNACESGGKAKILKADYKTDLVAKNSVDHFKPSAFVSLFSSEITNNYIANYRFYKWLFARFPTLVCGLVSGFYYSSNKKHGTIKETGDIQSWQTLEYIEDVYSTVFTEQRIILNVPSVMFGPDVYEVWKLFTKRSLV